MAETKNCYLTCAGRTDGIGAQVQATLSTLLTARELGLTYCHSPFKEIEHYADREHAAIQWERFFSLGKGELGLGDIPMDNLEVVHIDTPKPDEILSFKNHKNTLFIVKHCHDFADYHPDKYLDIQDQILEKYMHASKECYAFYYKPGKVNIAVHIRRGDVYKHRVNRFTSNEFYKDLLTDIMVTLDSFQLDSELHIYSQGQPADFGVLNDLDVTFHLDECTYTTFYNLTAADILVMAKSSFSYAAALFSNSIKIYQPFLHKPQRDWILADFEGEAMGMSFDQAKFKHVLESALMAKAMA